MVSHGPPTEDERRGGDPSADDAIRDPGVRGDHVDSWSSLAIDLLEGGQDDREAAVLAAHVGSCPECRAALEEQRATAAMLRATPLVPVPLGIQDAVLGAVSAAVETASDSLGEATPGPARRGAERRGSDLTQRLRALFRPRVWLPAAATAVVVVVAMVSWTQSGLGDQAALRTTASDDVAKSAAAEAESDTMAGSALTTGSAPGEGGATEATSTTAASFETQPPQAALAFEDLIHDLGAAGAEDPAVVWTTVESAGGEDAPTALLLRGIVDLGPLAGTETPDGLPAFAALLSTADVDTFLATLEPLETRLFLLSEADPGLPTTVLDRLRATEGDPLPLLRPADPATEGTALAWVLVPPETGASPPADAVVVVIAVRPAEG